MTEPNFPLGSRKLTQTQATPNILTPLQKEINRCAAHYFPMTQLERSHGELRAAVILAGKEIRKLNFGKRDTPVLQLLRRLLN